MYEQTYRLECAPGLCGRLRRRYPDGSIYCDTCGRVLEVDSVAALQHTLSTMAEERRSSNKSVAVLLGIGWLVLYWFHPVFARNFGILVLAIVALIYSPKMLFYLFKGIWLAVTFLYKKCRRSSLPRRTVVPVAASRSETSQSHETALATGD